MACHQLGGLVEVISRDGQLGQVEDHRREVGIGLGRAEKCVVGDGVELLTGGPEVVRRLAHRIPGFRPVRILLDGAPVPDRGRISGPRELVGHAVGEQAIGRRQLGLVAQGALHQRVGRGILDQPGRRHRSLERGRYQRGVGAEGLAVERQRVAVAGVAVGHLAREPFRDRGRRMPFQVLLRDVRAPAHHPREEMVHRPEREDVRRRAGAAGLGPARHQGVATGIVQLEPHQQRVADPAQRPSEPVAGPAPPRDPGGRIGGQAAPGLLAEEETCAKPAEWIRVLHRGSDRRLDLFHLERRHAALRDQGKAHDLVGIERSGRAHNEGGDSSDGDDSRRGGGPAEPAHPAPACRRCVLQGGHQIGAGLVAVRRYLGQCPPEGFLEGGGDRGPHDRDRGWLIHQVTSDDRVGGDTGEGRLAGQHLVQHAAERVQVGAAVEPCLA